MLYIMTSDEKLLEEKKAVLSKLRYLNITLTIYNVASTTGNLVEVMHVKLTADDSSAVSVGAHTHMEIGNSTYNYAVNDTNSLVLPKLDFSLLISI